MSYGELQEYYKAELKRIEALSEEKYAQWARSIPREPAREDFVIFEKKSANSASLSTDSDLIVKRDPSCGGICYDEKAYQKALQRYETDKQNALETQSEVLARISENMEKRAAAHVREPSSQHPAALNEKAKTVQAYEAAVSRIEAEAKAAKAKDSSRDLFITVDPESIRIP
jgi:hypothetical protein